MVSEIKVLWTIQVDKALTVYSKSKHFGAFELLCLGLEHECKILTVNMNEVIHLLHMGSCDNGLTVHRDSELFYSETEASNKRQGRNEVTSARKLLRIRYWS